MKKLLTLVLAAAMMLSVVCALADQIDTKDFTKWFEEEATWRTISNDKSASGGDKGGFITDASGAPTQEELKDILHMASLAVTSNGKTDWYMIAVTDPAEQLAIIGDKYGVATSEGTVTVLVFSERVLRDEYRTDDSNSFAPDRGYYDSGIVTGYLNVAAISKGYGTHMFMSPSGTDVSGVNGFNEGNIGLDFTKYTEGLEYVNGNDGESYSIENMKFVCAVVIGTLDETVETGLTTHEFPDNWTVR